MNIGVMSKATSNTIYTYVYDRYKTFSQYPDEHYVQYEIIEDTDARAYSFNGYQVVFDEEWTAPPVDTSDYDKMPKIYGFTKAEASQKHFHNIDYSGKDLTINLIPKRTIVKGEVQKVDWYSEVDVALQPSNLVLTVDVTYTRTGSGFAIYRTVKRTWINNDESENTETKNTMKYYVVNPSEAIDEGMKRRGLIIRELQMPILTGMQQVLIPLGYSEDTVLFKGRDFLDKYEPSFRKFVDNSSSINDPADPNYGRKSVIVEVEQEADPDMVEWLDLTPALFGGSITIRQYIMSALDI